MEQLKLGTGWRDHVSGPIYLLEASEDEREAVLVRWAASAGGALERDVRRVRPALLGTEWKQAPSSEVEDLIARLMRTDAADSLQGLQQAAKAQAIREEGSAVDRERLAAREERAREREAATAVPVARKSLWGAPTLTDADRNAVAKAQLVEQDRLRRMGVEPPPVPLRRELPADVAEARANAPMEERAGLVPPRTVRFEHDYPGAPSLEDPEGFTSNCKHGCGCWAGPSRSGGPEDVDPFGECPKHPGREMVRKAAVALSDVERATVLATNMQDLGEQLMGVAERMIFEARELRRLAGVDDDEQESGTDGA